MRFGMEAGHTLVARRGGSRGSARAAVGASQPVPRDGSLITPWREKRGCAKPLEPAEAGLLSNRLTHIRQLASWGASDRRQDRYDAVSDQHSLRLAIQRSPLIMSCPILTSVTAAGTRVGEVAIVGTCSIGSPV
jgi:hypothetical protein